MATILEFELLNEIELWRKARLAYITTGNCVSSPGGNPTPVVAGLSGEFHTEPEIAEVLAKIRSAFNKLEDARDAIVERKLRELKAI